MPGSATTVRQYLAELPPERRAVVARVRDVVNAHLPAGYVESVAWGMICWGIPLARYPDTYNGQPLGYACLAAQKNHFALYLNCLYMQPAEADWFARAFADAGRKLDMGKSCVRFRALDDLPLDVVGAAIARTSPDEFIAIYERARGATTAGARRTTARTAAGNAAARKTKATKTAKTTGARKTAKTTKATGARKAATGKAAAATKAAATKAAATRRAAGRRAPARER